MTTELTIKDELKGLEVSRAEQIEKIFVPMVEMLKGFENEYFELLKQEITPKVCRDAKNLRLDISKIRISADKERKSQKEEYLRAGNAIQGVYNILKFAVSEKEEKLKSIEDFFENQEKERVLKLEQDRIKEVSQYTDIIPNNLGSMDDTSYTMLLIGIKEARRIQDEELRLIEERKIKEDLHNKRVVQCSRLVDYIEGFDSVLFGDVSENDYLKLVDEAKTKRSIAEAEQEKIRLENEAMKKAEADRIAEQEKIRLENEAKEQALLNAGDSEKIKNLIGKMEEFSINLNMEITKEENKKIIATIKNNYNLIVDNLKKLVK